MSRRTSPTVDEQLRAALRRRMAEVGMVEISKAIGTANGRPIISWSTLADYARGYSLLQSGTPKAPAHLRLPQAERLAAYLGLRLTLVDG